MSLRTGSSSVTVMYGVRPCPTIPEDPWYQPWQPRPPVRRLPDVFKELLEETRKYNDIKSRADKLKTIARKLKKLGMKRFGRELTRIAAELYDLVEKEE